MVDYSDRFLGNTYASDEPVRFTVTLSGRADRVSVDVPESLFVRAQTIGSAYGLDLLPTIDVYATHCLISCSASRYWQRFASLPRL